MKGLKMHAALFVVAVVAALLTWNRDTVPEADRGLALAWERDTTDVVAVHYRSPVMDVRIQRRTDDDGSFLWAIEIEGAEDPDTLEFPVGAPGHTLVGRLASLRVIRDLGVLSPEMITQFGLDELDERITVTFRDGQRELALGDSIFGSPDRYVLEPATGTGYVVANDIVNPLRIGEGALRERFLHLFPDGDIGTVRVTSAGGERAMARDESGSWTPVDGGQPDEAFANFMQRVGQLAIGGYGADPAPGTLRPLLRVDYMDAEGATLGFVELLRDDSAESDPYLIRSERTRILAHAVSTLSERVEQGLGDVF